MSATEDLFRVVFLDIDGVLNSVAWFGADAFKGIIKVTSLDHWKRQIDAAAVSRLNRLLTATGAKIVVSSTWRTMLSLPELREVLRDRGCVGEIISITPGDDDRTRWREICEWIQEHWHEFGHPFNDQPRSFVILDDDPMPLAPVDRFIRTDYAVGLTDTDVDRAIAILKQDRPR